MHYLLVDTKKLNRKLIFHGYSRIKSFNLFHKPPCWDVGTRWYLHKIYTRECKGFSVVLCGPASRIDTLNSMEIKPVQLCVSSLNLADILTMMRG